VSEIGKLTIFLAFLCSCYGVVSIATGLRTGMAGPLRSGRRAGDACNPSPDFSMTIEPQRRPRLTAERVRS